MEEQLIKVLKVLIKEIFDASVFEGITYGTDHIIDRFLTNSELTLSPDSRQELIDYFNQVLNN